MIVMNKWKEISDSRKSKEGFGGVSYEDVWNLDTRLASIISVHLHAFLKASKSTPRGFPGIIGSANTEQGHQEWLKIIRKIIYAFDTYLTLDSTEKYEKDSEKAMKVNEGMQLFIDYFNYLWI